MFRMIYHPGAESPRVDLALLLLRVVVGGFLFLNAYWKLFGAQGPMAWNPNYPGWLQLLAAVAEPLGGLALVFGLFSRLAAFGVACVAGTAAFYQHPVLSGDPFVRPRLGIPLDLPTWLSQVGTQGGSSAFAMTIFAVAVAILLVGPGRASLDALLFRAATGRHPGSVPFVVNDPYRR